MEQLTEAFLNDFLHDVEQLVGIVIPLQLKRILFVNGFNNSQVIAQITEEDLNAIEEFSRDSLSVILDTQIQREQYFGIFANNTNQFKILSGHKKVLKIISDFYKAITPSNSVDHTIDKKNTSRKPVDKPCSRKVDPRANLSEECEEECNHLRRSIITWINKKCPAEKQQTIEECIEKIGVTPVYDESNKNILADSAHITCFCSTTVTVYRISKSERFQKRWILSNFHRHFTKHFAERKHTEKKTQSKHQTYSIESYFSRDIAFSNKPSTSTSNEGSVVVLSNILVHSDKNSNSRSVGLGQTEIDSQRDIGVVPNGDGQNNNVEDEMEDNLEISSEISESQNEQSQTCFTEKLPRKLPNNIHTVEHTLEPGRLQMSSYHNSKQKPRERLLLKWRDEKYSRHSRQERLRESKVDANQTKMTEFYPYIQKIQEFIHINPDIEKEFHKNIKEYSTEKRQCKEIVKYNVTETGTQNALVTNNFLQLLYGIAMKNSEKTSNHNTYDEVLKKFALYIFYTGGRLLYETLHANLTSILPSISCLNRYAGETGRHVSEGVFYFEELNKFLEERHLPKKVWISEDATRITGKVEYGPKENKILGFVLPLRDGIPVTNTYMATSAEKIQSYFRDDTKSNYAYVIMAQPLRANAPAFCLSVFGTDNRFTFKDVQSRWLYIREKAQDLGITIMGFSSDGDTRLMKAMRVNAILPIPNNSTEFLNNWSWFQMGFTTSESNNYEVSYVQDTIHIATKMRTRLLKPNIKLSMGNYNASLIHLKTLVETVSKDQHCLSLSDLAPEDKMNFLSAKNICCPKVTELLQDNIPDSQGTCMFLKIMNFSTAALLEKNLTVSTRLSYLWYSIFCLRIWRQWIVKHHSYKIKDNFLSSNCYLSIELNGHSLIRIIRNFRDQGVSPESFVPWLFSSQPCEKLFRVTRSMTSTYSTVVNFSIKDILHRVNRIQLINNIINDLDNTGDGGFTFPREKKRTMSQSSNMDFVHLSDEDIENIVSQARSEAIRDTKVLGMIVDNDSLNCLFIPLNYKQTGTADFSDEDDNEIDESLINAIQENDKFSNAETRGINDFENEYSKENDAALDAIRSELSTLLNGTSFGKYLKIKDFSGKKNKVDSEVDSDDCHFLEVLINGKKYTIKKSTFCWLLDEKAGKISTDRLRRFVQSKNKSGCNGKKVAKSKGRFSIKQSSKSKGKKRQKTKESEEESLSDTSSICSDDSRDLCDDDSLDDITDLPNPLRLNSGNNDQNENTSNEELCVICGDFGKSETWYRCTSCGKWAHSDCTAADSPQGYVCDFCL